MNDAPSDMNYHASIARPSAGVDVFFRAKDYRPQWLAYGAGALLAGWYLILLLVWTWQWTTDDEAGLVRHLLWPGLPVIWAISMVFGSQLLFALAEVVSRITNLPRSAPQLLASTFNIAVIGWIAWLQTASQHCVFQQMLGWIGLAGIFIVAALEMITRRIASKETILDIKQKV